MSLPIKPTPILSEKESEDFWNKVKEKLDIPVKKQPKPDFEKIKNIWQNK